MVVGKKDVGGGGGKPFYVMRGRPVGMPLDVWYEAIYQQWHRRESWCQMYDRPLMEVLPTRKHFPQFNRSVIRFQTPRKSMVFTLKDEKSRGGGLLPDPGRRRCGPKPSNSILAKIF